MMLNSLTLKCLVHVLLCEVITLLIIQQNGDALSILQENHFVQELVVTKSHLYFQCANCRDNITITVHNINVTGCLL